MCRWEWSCMENMVFFFRYGFSIVGHSSLAHLDLEIRSVRCTNAPICAKWAFSLRFSTHFYDIELWKQRIPVRWPPSTNYCSSLARKSEQLLAEVQRVFVARFDRIVCQRNSKMHRIFMLIFLESNYSGWGVEVFCLRAMRKSCCRTGGERQATNVIRRMRNRDRMNGWTENMDMRNGCALCKWVTLLITIAKCLTERDRLNEKARMDEEKCGRQTSGTERCDSKASRLFRKIWCVKWVRLHSL